jgi:RNA polymerase sigma factor (sigma-70 family)
MSSGEDREAAHHRRPTSATGGVRDDTAATLAAMRQDFLDLFDAEFALLVRFVMRDGATLHDAQDSAQHAFMQGWRAVRDGRWERIDRPRAWIRTVALRHHRARARAEVPVSQAPETAAPGPGHAELTGQARDLVAALRLLDDDARAVLAFHLDDIPTCDIAAHLNITDQRARDLLKKARRTLRRHLAAPPHQPTRTADGPATTGHEGRHRQ